MFVTIKCFPRPFSKDSLSVSYYLTVHQCQYLFLYAMLYIYRIWGSLLLYILYNMFNFYHNNGQIPLWKISSKFKDYFQIKQFAFCRLLSFPQQTLLLNILKYHGLMMFIVNTQKIHNLSFFFMIFSLDFHLQAYIAM